MLKILAIQVQKDCAEYIKKCLVPGCIYYLCHDYEFSVSENGLWSIKKSEGYVNTLNDDFFRISGKTDLNINVSAIVGENGSGKSTIVEIILRMLNNSSIRYDIRAEEGSLVYVDGVYASLIYQSGDGIYCLSMAGSEDSVVIREIGKLESGEVTFSNRELTKEELRGHFFYTLVSNYSHYAYNTYDFRKEWQKQTDEDSCWLKWLFHKNDGYQTPITLHPFRDQGTVSIEREKNLSNQRLLYFFINYAKKHQEDGVFNHINGKKPRYLNLQVAKSSKLQQVTLLRFFADNRNVVLLGNQIRFVESLDGKMIRKGSSEYNDFIGGIYRPLEYLANRVLGLNKADTEGHHHYYKTMLEWLVAQNEWWQEEYKTSIFSGNSDFRHLLSAIESMAPLLPKDTYKEIRPIFEALRAFDILNICQLQRLEVLDDVCDFWKGNRAMDLKDDLRFDVEPETIISKYDDLSQKQRCHHYIVYKTIDILETYPSYHYPLWAYSNRPIWFASSVDRPERNQVQVAFAQLIKDVTEEKTHITLKMRQAFYYLNNTTYKRGKDGYQLAGKKVGNIDGICLSTEKLAELYKNEDEQNLETLPPPIFERHLLFKAEDGQLIDIDTFSSGERQLLNTQSAIIYHLQNLSSIFKDPTRMKYPQVNIILEEIELYFHPDYQRSFILSLINLLEGSRISENIKEINILIVTHSPFILSDIPKSHVLFLKEGKATSGMQMNTFGANIHNLLKNGFFLPGLPMGEFAHMKIDELFAKLNSGEFPLENLDDIYRDVMQVGEPVIRNELMMLLGGFRSLQVDDQVVKKILERIAKRNDVEEV